MAANWRQPGERRSFCPVIEASLQHGDAVIAEAGRMLYRSPGISFSSSLHSATPGFGARLRSLVGRKLSGEGAFLARFEGPGTVGFAPAVPGELRRVNLGEGRSLIVQRGAFLAAEASISIDLAWVRKIRAMFFGGEGIIMQRLSGPGSVWIHACGGFVDFSLDEGEVLLADTGSIVALGEGVDFSIRRAGKASAMLLGGEGLFLTELTGPGPVTLQSMTIGELSNRIAPPAA